MFRRMRAKCRLMAHAEEGNFVSMFPCCITLWLLSISITLLVYLIVSYVWFFLVAGVSWFLFKTELGAMKPITNYNLFHLAEVGRWEQSQSQLLVILFRSSHLESDDSPRKSETQFARFLAFYQAMSDAASISGKGKLWTNTMPQCNQLYSSNSVKKNIILMHVICVISFVFGSSMPILYLSFLSSRYWIVR